MENDVSNIGCYSRPCYCRCNLCYCYSNKGQKKCQILCQSWRFGRTSLFINQDSQTDEWIIVLNLTIQKLFRRRFQKRIEVCLFCSLGTGCYVFFNARSSCLGILVWFQLCIRKLSLSKWTLWGWRRSDCLFQCVDGSSKFESTFSFNKEDCRRQGCGCKNIWSFKQVTFSQKSWKSKNSWKICWSY